MNKRSGIRVADVRGAARLAIDASIGLTDLVEAMHRNVLRTYGLEGRARTGRTTGITGFVYRTIRGVTTLVGGGIDALLAPLTSALSDAAVTSPERDAVLAALNGVLGDHLAATRNPLALSMALRYRGTALSLQPAMPVPQTPGARIVVLIHGLCMNDLQWLRNGHDHGAALETDLGIAPVYLRYNTGLHVSTNGRALAERLEALVRARPVPVTELDLLGHSMGGLVARSACEYGRRAGHDWLHLVRRMIFLGSPHHGAPLERGGQWVHAALDATPYSEAFARLGRIRSAGITDLRHGNLIDEDWAAHDRFAHAADARVPVPLPRGVQCLALAASLAESAGKPGQRWLGDGLVPLDSALGRHENPAFDLGLAPDHRWIGYGMNHLDLLDRAEVYAQIRRWMTEGASLRPAQGVRQQ